MSSEKEREKEGKKFSIVWIILLLLIVGGVIAGSVYKNSLSVSSVVQHINLPQTGGLGTGVSVNGTSLVGSIETLNGNGFTMTLEDGTTKDVQLSATTTIKEMNGSSATSSNLTLDQLSVGERVTVSGSPNQDGSISASRVEVQLMPAQNNGGSVTPVVK